MSESNAKLRIVVDTNLVVSATIVKRGNAFALVQAWRSGVIIVLLSTDQHTELTDVLHRDKFARDYGVAATEVDELFELIDASPRVTPTPSIPVHLRDPKDVHILAAALGGGADYLVTGDFDLHEVAGDPRRSDLRIVTVREFLEILSESESL